MRGRDLCQTSRCPENSHDVTDRDRYFGLKALNPHMLIGGAGWQPIKLLDALISCFNVHNIL
jgi:hypothetical protein